MIETIGASPVAAIALQWHTRVKYLTDTPVFYLYGTLVIKERDLENCLWMTENSVRTVGEKLPDGWTARAGSITRLRARH